MHKGKKKGTFSESLQNDYQEHGNSQGQEGKLRQQKGFKKDESV